MAGEDVVSLDIHAVQATVSVVSWVRAAADLARPAPCDDWTAEERCS
jgi:hypothetical protein